MLAPWTFNPAALGTWAVASVAAYWLWVLVEPYNDR